MTTAPAYCRRVAYQQFGQWLPETGSIAGLFRAAWQIARHEMPDADLAAGESVVENLAATVRSRARSRQPTAVLAHLHDVLFDLFGLQGNADDYYAPANSYLPAVLETRRGIPITLTLLYLRVAAELGIRGWGVNAPGHFLAEVIDAGGDSMIVDAFDGGRLLTIKEAMARITEITGRSSIDQAHALARATPRQWLDRMLNNLQASFAAAGQQRDVYAMQELQQLLRQGPG